ncbi:MAG: DMT family transporter, partial [Myxococcota bacterium]
MTDDASLRRGIGHLLSSAFFFSLMSLFVKLAGERLPSSTMVFARALLTCVLSYVWLRRTGLSPFGNARRLLFLRGVLGFVALTLFYFAITKLPLAEVTVLHYLNPLFTVVFARVFLRERAPKSMVWAMLLAFAGTVLVARPQFLFGHAETLAQEGVLAAIGGAMAAR